FSYFIRHHTSSSLYYSLSLHDALPILPILARTSNGNRVLLTAAIAEFLEETKLTKKPKTLSAYRTALHYFQESCHKLYVQDIERDRKSTRLNSSHGSISYAVFCLKKKK